MLLEEEKMIIDVFYDNKHKRKILTMRLKYLNNFFSKSFKRKTLTLKLTIKFKRFFIILFTMISFLIL